MTSTNPTYFKICRYMRFCRRCKTVFRTTAKRGTVCKNCSKGRNKFQYIEDTDL